MAGLALAATPTTRECLLFYLLFDLSSRALLTGTIRYCNLPSPASCRHLHTTSCCIHYHQLSIVLPLLYLFTSPLSCRRFFDPASYRIILLDQRGCGRSTPTACLAENTTADLFSDLETLRQALNIDSWLLLGGSWGVALSIAYAQAHPDRVLGLILRGVCLMRPSEIQWMYGGGAAALKPLAWSRFAGTLPARERGNPLLAYYKRMLSSDAGERQAAVSGNLLLCYRRRDLWALGLPSFSRTQLRQFGVGVPNLVLCWCFYVPVGVAVGLGAMQCYVWYGDADVFGLCCVVCYVGADGL
jgi:pimeloyl-ACP methyl ester carboxylesterase